jgi:hypothetical protein
MSATPCPFRSSRLHAPSWKHVIYRLFGHFVAMRNSAAHRKWRGHSPLPLRPNRKQQVLRLQSLPLARVPNWRAQHEQNHRIA